MDDQEYILFIDEGSTWLMECHIHRQTIDATIVVYICCSPPTLVKFQPRTQNQET